jgi:hypothetical protein
MAALKGYSRNSRFRSLCMQDLEIRAFREPFRLDLFSFFDSGFYLLVKFLLIVIRLDKRSLGVIQLRLVLLIRDLL